MMDEALTCGAIFGAAVGVVHGGYVYAQRASRPGHGSLEPLYYALWTFVLWVVFGSYVLYLGLLAITAYAARNAIRSLAGPRVPTTNVSTTKWT